MQLLRSNRLTNPEYWDVAKDTVLRSQRTELADSLFSIPEGVWHSIRWHADVDIQKANNSEFNVASVLYLDIGDPLNTENMLQEKLDRVYYRLLKVEALCRDMLAFYKTDPNINEAMKQEDEILERMNALGLLEGDNQC